MNKEKAQKYLKSDKFKENFKEARRCIRENDTESLVKLLLKGRNAPPDLPNEFRYNLKDKDHE